MIGGGFGAAGGVDGADDGADDGGDEGGDEGCGDDVCDGGRALDGPDEREGERERRNLAGGRRDPTKS